MKIIEQTATRLAFSIGVPYFNVSHCTFDRTAGRATIKRVMLFWPLKPIDVPLEDVAGAMLSGAATTSQGGAMRYPIVLLKSGRRISLASFGEAAAKRAVEAITAFLEQRERSAATATRP